MNTKHQLQKLILVSDSRHRRDEFLRIGHHLERMGISVIMNNPYSVIDVEDTLLGNKYQISFCTTNMWSSADHIRGYRYSEVLSCPRSLQSSSYREEVINAAISHIEVNNDDTPLSQNHLLTHIINLGFESAVKDREEMDTLSLSPSFHLPLSLYTREMLKYFNDLSNPAPDEFLLALTMEGINAKTIREKEAVSKALELSSQSKEK